MDQNNEALGEFFSGKKQQEMDAIKRGTDNASSEERKNIPIDAAGNYLCEVATFAYTKDGEYHQQPNIYLGSETKSLNLSVVLKVVDGTERVQKGASIFANITLCPGGEVTEEAINKVMNFAKPKIVAMTGQQSINITPEWINEWLLPKFVLQGKTYKLIKDHKMKNRVMAIVDYGVNNGKLGVKSITKATPTDKSQTYNTDQPKSNVDIPTSGSVASSGPSFANVVDSGVNAPADVPHVPEVEEF